MARMAFNPGRNVGRLSIRVVPDTTKFRRELRRQLEAIERTTSMTVRVSKAKLDNRAIREDIRRQMEGFKDLAIDARVDAKVAVDSKALKDIARIKPTLDRLTVQRIRRDIDKVLGTIEPGLTPTIEDRRLRQQLDVLRSAFDKVSGRLENDILSPASAERLRLRLNEIKDQIEQIARNRETRIEANPFTAWASARLAWLTRPRTVEIFVRVSKASVAAALTTLSALSGARLSFQWIDDLTTMARNLDKNLPSILGWTTGVTSLVASLFAATSGLVGLGQGLFSILPAFLVAPGLILNAAGSLTALVVALRHAGEELSPLKSGMTDLARIIRSAFWDQARQPILDLVNGLMPQLRNSFRELSTGVGQFTGALADAFGQELAGGRLESIFSGIAEGWRILSTGAPAFAGAMTSLSQIAAKYTPRLAQWFVRQANTFDTWLEAISTDGRLDSWMEGAIRSMYDLWDATKGIAGVFKGLWRAANAAGSKGLAGFADMMQEWDRVVNGADFQRGLTAVFRGSSVAMGAFGDAVRAIGRLVADLDGAFERFIGSSGRFFFGLFEGAANALNQASVGMGLDDLSSGLIRALEGVLPHLPTIASTFGSFLGLLGDLAGTLLPTAASVLADLMPSIDSVISSIRDSGVLQTLGDAVADISSTLGPALKDFADAAGPVLVDALVGLAEALVDIAPVLTALIAAIGDWIEALGEWSTSNGEFFDAVRKFLGADLTGGKALSELGKLGEFMPKDDGNPWTVEVKFDFDRYWNNSKLTVGEKSREIANVFMDEYERVLASEGQDAADALVASFRDIEGMPPEVVARINEQLQKSFKIDPSASDAVATEASRIADRITKSFADGNKNKAWMSEFWSVDPATRRQILSNLGDLADEAREMLNINRDGRSGGGGGGFSRQLAQGIRLGLPELDESMRAMRDTVTRGMEGSETWLTPSGTSIMGGLRDGIDAQKPILTADMAGMGVLLSTAMAAAGSWLYPTGSAVMGGMQAGALAGRGGVVSAFSGLQGSIGAVLGGASGWFYGVGVQMMAGIVRGIVAGSDAVARAAASAVDRAVASARAAAEINSPSRRTGREIGLPLVQGIAVGIRNGASDVQRAIDAAVSVTGGASNGTDRAPRAGVSYVHNGDLVAADTDGAVRQIQTMLGRAIAAAPLT